ncbi:MAG TPA: hypothetical protein VFB49_08940 [Patescibacteria group bacterium]|nr:hypothetical protein [Patescibacteria group bacterium]
MSRNVLLVLVLGVLVAAVPLAGCGGQGSSPQAPVADQQAPPPAGDQPTEPPQQAAAPVPQPPPPAPKASRPSASHASAIPEEAPAAAPVPPAPQMVTFTIPAGTQFAVGFGSEITSETAASGDSVVATLKQPIIVGDRVLFPQGSQVHGTISDVKSAKKGFKDTGGALSIQFSSIVAPDGTKAAIAAAMTKVAEGSAAKKGAIIGGSAVGGALLGRMLGKNTAGSAAVGAAVGTAVAGTTKGREAVIKPEDDLQLSLEQNAKVAVKR